MLRSAQDLALLVHEQGSQIDNIQTNVENAAGRVHGGVAQLQTAAKSQKHYRRKLCYGLAFTAVAIIVLLAVLKLVLKAALPF
jgi:t-SNARE complex subunit (syntaxin)